MLQGVKSLASGVGTLACRCPTPLPQRPAHLTRNSGTSPAAGTLGLHMPVAPSAIQGPCLGEPGSGMSGAGG